MQYKCIQGGKKSLQVQLKTVGMCAHSISSQTVKVLVVYFVPYLCPRMLAIAFSHTNTGNPPHEVHKVIQARPQLIN